MLRNASGIIGNAVKATDGAIGSIDDMLFDDEQWILRWIVVDTGNWLPGRRVLLPPQVFAAPDPVSDEVAVDLGREQIKASPPADSDRPVSRQDEADLFAHYGWDPYWGAGSGYPAAGAGIDIPSRALRSPPDSAGKATKDDPHLRSMNAVRHYSIQALDDEIGHAEDFLIDDTNWRIAYLIVDTRNWWPSKRVLVSPRWLDDVSWSQNKIYVALDRDRIKNSPAYNPGNELDPDYEAELDEYYGMT
jgi:hypothetical protein